MTSHELYSLSYDDAMRTVVLYALEKQANLSEFNRLVDPGLRGLGSQADNALSVATSRTGSSSQDILQSLVADPRIRRVLTGAAIGGGIGVMDGSDFDEYGRRKSRLGKILRMAALGGAIGGGYDIAENYLKHNPAVLAKIQRRAHDLLTHLANTTRNVVGDLESGVKKSADDNATRAQLARQELGILGIDEDKLDKAMAELRKGKIDLQQAKRQAFDAIPSVYSQLRNIPASINVSARQGDIGNVIAQTDVLGLKNINPFAENFSPTAAAASVGLGGIGLHLRRMRDLTNAARGTFPGVEGGMVQNYQLPRGMLARLRELFLGPGILEAKQRLAQAKPEYMTRWRSIRRMAPVVTLASLPLLYREWLGSGYRSGNKPISTLAEINKPDK